MNERTKHKGEALSALNSLLDGLSNYACNRLAGLEDKVVEIHIAITKTESHYYKNGKNFGTNRCVQRYSYHSKSQTDNRP